MKRQFDLDMVCQKLFGVLLIALSVVIVCITIGGTTPIQRDGTALCILVPAGIALLTTKKKVFNVK